MDLPSISASITASNEEAPAALVAAMGRLTESWWAKAPVRRSSHLPSSSGYLAIVNPQAAPQTPQTSSNSKATLNSALQTIDKELQGSFSSSDFLIRDVPNGSEGCESDWRLLAQICVEIPVVWTSLIKPLSPESTYIESLLNGTYEGASPSLLPPPLASQNNSELSPNEGGVGGTKTSVTASSARTVQHPSSPQNGPHRQQLSDNILLSSWVVVADGWKAGKSFLKRFQNRDVRAPYSRNTVPQSPLSPNDYDPDYIPPYVTQLRYLSKLPQTIVEGIYLVAEVLRSLVVQPNVGGCMAALAALHHLLLQHMLFTQKLAGELGLGPKVPSPQCASTSPPMTNTIDNITLPSSSTQQQVWRDRLTKCNFIVVLEKLYVGLSLRFQLFFGMALGRPLQGKGEVKPPSTTTTAAAASTAMHSVMEESTSSQNQQHLVTLDMCLGTAPTVPTTEREKTHFHLTSQHGKTLSTRFGALLVDDNFKEDSIVVHHDQQQHQQHQQVQQQRLLDAPPAFPSLLKPAGGGGGGSSFLMGHSSTTSLLHPPADGGGGPSFGSFPDTGLLGSATPRDMSQLSASSSSFRHYSTISGRRSDLSILPPGGTGGSVGGPGGSGSTIPEQIHVVPHIASTPLGLSLVAIRQALRKSGFQEINIALVVDVRHMMGFNSEAKFGKPHTPLGGNSADGQQQVGGAAQQQQHSSASNRRRHSVCWKDNAFTVSSSLDVDSQNHDAWLHDRIPSYHRQQVQQQQHHQTSLPSSAEEEAGGGGGSLTGGSNEGGGEPTIDIVDIIQEGQQATSSDNFVGCALSPPTMTTECMKHLVVVAALKGPELRGQDTVAPNYAMFRGKDTVVFVTTAPSAVLDSGPFYLAISASIPDTTHAASSQGVRDIDADGSSISGNSSAISTKSKGISGLFNRMFNTGNKRRTESVIVGDGTESHISRATCKQSALESRSDGELDRMFTSTILSHCNSFHGQLLMVPQAQIIRFDQSE